MNANPGCSLKNDSPSVLLDVDTETRVLHWLELDAHAEGNSARQTLFMRPATILVPGHRHVVAICNLKTETGDEVIAEAAFAALRDRTPTNVQAIEDRREQMERDVFAPLVANGITRGELESYGYPVTSDPLLDGNALSENLFAKLLGIVTPERTFLIGAHFDTVRNSLGADDNASGVAGMLEIARVLAGSSFASSIEFVAFAYEESGLVGGRQHAEAAKAARRHIIGMYSFEMIGYTTDRTRWIGVLANTASAALRSAYADAVARYVPALELLALDVPGNGECLNSPVCEFFQCGCRRSDHASFWDVGFPALLITDTADFRNPNYHTPSDTPDKLDYAFAQRTTQAARGSTRYGAVSPNGSSVGPTRRQGNSSTWARCRSARRVFVCTAGLLLRADAEPARRAPDQRQTDVAAQLQPVP